MRSDNLESKKNGITLMSVEGNVGVLYISNGKQNTIPEPDFLDLEVLQNWLSEQNIYGLIITSHGRHFSAGADIEYIRANKTDTNNLREKLKKGREILSYIESLPMVTVAAISGVCFGGGLEIVLSCQFRIATENAILAFPESNIGIMPGLAGTVRLPQLIGKTKALEMIISGKSVTAQEALEMGLIDKIVPNKEHLAAALNFVNELAQNKSCRQIRGIVQSVNNSIQKAGESAMEYESEFFLEMVEDF